jgi:beta-phosphoglucomutase family hydrolase
MITIKSNIKALIFDCDGTLADTMPFHYRAWQETLQPLGGEFPQKLFYDTAGMTSEQIVAILNERFGYRLDPQKIVPAKEIRFTQLATAIKPIKPVAALARQYHGRLPMAVATGGVADAVQTTLETIGMSNVFDTVVSREDVVNGKPAPDTFLEAARRLQVDPQDCLVFEDSEAGLEAARRAGMTGVDVRPWYQTRV